MSVAYFGTAFAEGETIALPKEGMLVLLRTMAYELEKNDFEHAMLIVQRPAEGGVPYFTIMQVAEPAGSEGGQH